MSLTRSRLSIWTDAARPHTLPAAVMPVVLGASLALSDQVFQWIPSLVALLCAVLIQIGTNFANDYFDFRKGADTAERIGFERATASGWLTADQMKRATVLTMSLAFLLGLWLVWHAGWVILLIGVLSLLFGVLYTGGPWPLGYNGLGDLFVFLFFGIIAVTATYYVNALEWSEDSIWASLTAGALSTNILVVNNLRDVEQDGPAGKNTLGVLLGENALRMEYLLMVALAFAIPLHFYFRLGYGLPVLLPLAVLPGVVMLIRPVLVETEKRRLNRTLKQTAQFMVLFILLFSIGIVAG